MDSPSSEESDRDVALDEDLEELRRACLLSPTCSPIAASYENSDIESESGSDADEDADLLRRLKAQIQDSPPRSPSFVQPLNTRPPFYSLESASSVREAVAGLDDDSDDYETFRNIQRMLARYEAEALKTEATSTSTDGAQELTEEDYGNAESQYDQMAPSQKKFPKSAQMLFEALKKNRSCQKFVRRKLIEMETKIEENKELRDRVKCLMDFQLACKKRAGRALALKRDPRVRLISFERLKEPQEGESKNNKKKSALYFGPKENWWALDYKMVQEQFPISMRKQSWSGSEKENLFKGLKQQCQEMFLLSSVNIQSDAEGVKDLSLLPAFLNADFDITAEKMRCCMPFVQWDQLASMYLPGRSGAECESRFLNCEDPLVNHEPWTRQEEKRLLLILQNRGIYNWINIAVELGTNRTPFQCLVRYQRSLNPLILNREWTKEEDMQLLAMVETFGEKNWQLVAAQLEGRAANQCATRWRQTLNPKRTTVGRWSLEEDKRLKAAVMIFGNKCWKKICHFVPGRTQPQCRERWVNCLDPALNHKPWSKEEDSMLLEAVKMHGHCWSKITKLIPSRTDNQCWRRWKLLCPQANVHHQTTRKIKRTMLISNFVDRQSERPEICPDDFAIVPEMNFEKTNKNAAKKNPRKNCHKKRKDDNNAMVAVEQNPADNLQNNSLGEQCHDETLIVEDLVLTTADTSHATVGKRKRCNSTSLETGNGTLKKKKMVKIPHSERKKDPWWVHAERLEGNRTHWKCKYCNQVFKGGGVSRLKMHIAGFSGDIVSCLAVPQEIRESIKVELEKQGKKLEPRKRKYKGNSKEAVTMDESNKGKSKEAVTMDESNKGKSKEDMGESNKGKSKEAVTMDESNKGKSKEVVTMDESNKGKSKEALTMDESNPLQIVLAIEAVPAPWNGLLAISEKRAKKYTPRRKKQTETSKGKESKEDTLDKDVEEGGKKPKPALEKQKEMNKGKEREEGTMFGKEIGEAPAATGEC
ncbi:myb domain protein 4r1 isoform X2 [Carex rostrata]